MTVLKINEPGREILMMGNEAIARGALEAGVDFVACYPGSPSSEIVDSLAKVADQYDIYVEYSVNEMVALAAASGASYAGLRALAVMKQNGANVASDLLGTLNISGTRGGLVIVIADDPGGLSSTNEVDSRSQARSHDLPMFEPSGPAEAREMMHEAFDVSERYGLPVIVRSVTRISHGRANVTMGEMQPRGRKADFGADDRYATLPPTPNHQELHRKFLRIRQRFEKSRFNSYVGPEDAKLVIITSGSGWLYSLEAAELLDLQDEIGILKLGTSWPLPEHLILKHLEHAEQVLIVEEVDPLLEQSVMALAAAEANKVIKFFGQRSGHIVGDFGQYVGERNVDQVTAALAEIFGKPNMVGPQAKVKELTPLPPRELAFCAGCPHRASFFSIKQAIELDGRQGVVLGDIGCYTLGFGRTGYWLSRTMHCMGSAPGFACGMGQLERFGFEQPVVAIVGDSTLFHSCIPPIINARWNDSAFVLVILDNDATAMTGFQPHPGTGRKADGPAAKISIEQMLGSFEVDYEVIDSFEMEKLTEAVVRRLNAGKFSAIISRHTCGLLSLKQGREKLKMHVDADKCRGASCGCDNFCSRVFSCPGLFFDAVAGTAKIDEVICTGCGLCVDICPVGAIEVLS
jgi:indolepyruvate ferredoxin oxidoreductase, alpha subunit